ncbi:hypothetical protein A5784_11655 [Mycobacterium sp. 852013-50091_SCH5140682]|nr:hypothetical protein A5784_11655 [Mycobacterium sp. 852013-50091_SCH5140682]
MRSYLIAGAAAATATTIALTPVQVTPADIAVPAHPTSSAQPQLTQAMVELLAAASRMTAAVPTVPKPAPVPGSGPTTGAAPALATPNAVVTPQNAASDFVTSAYQYIQSWVDWGVNYGVDIAYWLGGWGVPFAGLIGAQTDIFYYQLIRPISNSVVYNLINPVLNAPLNLGVWANGIVDVGWSIAAAAWNTVVAEANYFLGWVLPPLPPLPPGLPFAATAQTTSLTATAPTQTLSTALAGVGERLASAFKGLTEGASLLNVADVKTKPTADLTDTTGATGDVKNPVQTVVTDVETAASGAADLVKDATENVADALPGTTAPTQTDEVTTVPKSVQQSLQLQKQATTDKSVGTSRQTRINDVRDGVRNATEGLKSTVQKATDGLRNAAKGAGKTTTDTKTKVNKTDKPSKDNSDNSGGD